MRRRGSGTRTTSSSGKSVLYETQRETGSWKREQTQASEGVRERQKRRREKLIQRQTKKKKTS